MADPTSVNSQITDAVTQSGLSTVGMSQAVSLGNLYQAMGQALALAAHNATSNQQHLNIVANAVTTACVTLMQGKGSPESLLELLEKVPSAGATGKQEAGTRRKKARK